MAAFEEEFGALVDGRHCVAVNSGSSALYLSLLAMGIGTGDEVIVPSFSSVATANAVRLSGATPVFADIDPDTFCLDPGAVAAVISPFTAAVVPVHLFGHPADMGRLCAVTERHGIALIENAAQAHAATLYGKPVGTFGSTAVFSMGAGKNMHSVEGGMVATGDANLARTLRMLRNQGRDQGRDQGVDQPHSNQMVGTNVRLTDLAAAVGREQLKKLPGFTARRRENAKALGARLRGVVTPPARDGVGHVYHQYTVRVPGNGRPDRDAFARALASRGVGSEVLYPTPVHRTRAYRFAADVPETERAAEQVLSLPVHPGLSRRELQRVISACNALGGLLTI